MNFQFSISTERLLINPLSPDDNYFILELLNTASWIKFIGDRNIHSAEDADVYIQKILNNENLFYCTVKLKGSGIAIGIVTFIKRDYLEHHDIGFAFLPQFSKKGYAYEATTAVLNKLQAEHKLSHILAVTMPQNKDSVSLLVKMGLVFEREIEVGKEKLLIYGLLLTAQAAQGTVCESLPSYGSCLQQSVFTIQSLLATYFIFVLHPFTD